MWEWETPEIQVIGLVNNRAVDVLLVLPAIWLVLVGWKSWGDLFFAMLQ
jgi:hypothetical protein